MRVTCEKCDSFFEVDDRYAGRRARCSHCNHRFLLPFGCSKELLHWIATGPWHRVFRFVTRGGARGHTADVIQGLIRTFEERRFEEENRVRRDAARALQKSDEQARLERIALRRRNIQRQLRQKQELQRLCALNPAEFEVLIANLYRAKGYEAFAVGGGADQGIDVKIFKGDGQSLWAIAQCKRYSLGHKVTSNQIREFVGSYGLSGAREGYYFTTSEYTHNALTTASKFSWLTTYSGEQLVLLIGETSENMLL